jgi:hypothetical protein
VAKATIASLKLELYEACAYLRSFTLGQPGFTQKDGVAGIERVSQLCDRLKKLASGPKAEEVTAAIATGRNRITAANSRLNLLRGKSRASSA